MNESEKDQELVLYEPDNIYHIYMIKHEINIQRHRIFIIKQKIKQDIEYIRELEQPPKISKL